jgi:hypothetical protein
MIDESWKNGNDSRHTADRKTKRGPVAAVRAVPFSTMITPAEICMPDAHSMRSSRAKSRDLSPTEGLRDLSTIRTEKRPFFL